MGLLNLLKPAQIKERIYKVGISPGHGGEDPGAVGAHGTTEAFIARDFSAKLYEQFKSDPLFSPAIYGADQKKKDYVTRVKDSNNGRDDFYIPVHLNASTSRRSNGWLILLDPADIKQNPLLVGLAASILKELQWIAPIGFSDWDTKKDGILAGEDRPIYELSKPRALSVYLELGFVSNPEWEFRMISPGFTNKLAMAVYQGFKKYLTLVNMK